MSSTLSHSSSSVHRKSLKRPDEFFAALQQFFDGLGKHLQGFIIFALLALIVGSLAVVWMTRQEGRTGAGRNALFQAQKSLEKDLKAIAAESAPPAAPAKADAKDATKKAPEPSIETVLFKKLDVDAKFGPTVVLFKGVIDRYSGTLPGFEAAVALGQLYYDHGDAAKAMPWFEKALSQAATPFDKAAMGSALGHTLEDQGKNAEAISAYETALKIGNVALKGELMLSVARNQELSRDTAKARSTYDQIILQLPATEYARSAEVFKAQLQ